MEVIEKNLKHFLVFLTVKTLIFVVYELLKIIYYNKVNSDFVL